MKKHFGIVFLLIFGSILAQEKPIQSVYFDFDSFTLNKNQMTALVQIMNTTDFFQYEAIQLYGYCDDRGRDDYNNKLSARRVTFVQNFLVSKGVALHKIFICEGKGRVLFNKDSVKNIEKTRDKNRRVDLIFVKHNSYTSFPINPKVGDIITLDKVLFEMGSSALSIKSKKELDRSIAALEKNKNLRFEIRGHVCCTPNEYNDAVDQQTDERNLSINRAKNVFTYLRSKGINPYRMAYKGYGNRFPLHKGDAQDRRVEFLVTKI